MPRFTNGVPDARRGAVRHLHARHAGIGGRPLARHAGAHRATGDGCPRWRPLPLHGVPQDHHRRDERGRGRGRRAVTSGRQGRRSSRATRGRTTQGGRHGCVRRRRLPRRGPRHPGGAFAVPPSPLPAGRPGRVRRCVTGGRSGPDRGRHPRPQPLRRDPGDRRSAGLRGTRRGGAFPGRGGRHDRRGARADGCAGHGNVPGRLERAPTRDVDRRRPGVRRAPAPPHTRGQRPHPWQRSPRRARPGVRGGGDRSRGRLRDRLHRARVHRAGGRVRGAHRRPGRGAGDDAVPAHGPDRARGDPGPARGGGADQAHGGRRGLREQARPVGAAVPRPGGVDAGTARAPHVHATRIDDVHHETAPLAAPCPRRRHARRPAHRDGLHRRVQHRGVRIVGIDGGEPCARARRRSVRL